MRFSIQRANDEILLSILLVQCPYILFPSIRSILMLLMQESHRPPLSLQPQEFLKILHKKLSEES